MGIMVNEPEPDTYTELIDFRLFGGDKPRRYFWAGINLAATFGRG